MLVWGAVVVCLYAARADEPPPDTTTGVTLSAAGLDFGTVAPQSCHQRSLQVVNLTKCPVRLLDSDADCDCLCGTLDMTALEPGAQTRWQITLNTCDYLGEARRFAWVQTDHAQHRLLKLPVRYRVVPEVFAEPEFVSLGLLGSDEVAVEVQVRTLGEEPVHLLQATCSTPGVFVDLLDEQVSSTLPATVHISVCPPVPEGSFRPTVFVESDSAAVPRLRIPLLGESVRGLRADRRALVFEQVPLGTSQTQRLTLTHDPGVHVGGARTVDDAVDVQSVEREGEKVVITLRTSPRLPLGTFRGMLILEVNNGTARKLKLPYCGQVVVPTSEINTEKTMLGDGP